MKLFLFSFSFLTVILTSSSVLSQDQGAVERLERRLMALEQRFFSTQPATQANVDETLKSADTPKSSAVADMEARLQMLEEEAQRVYGAVEELGNSVDRFAKKMEVMAQDFDLRLKDLEAAALSGSLSMQNAQEEQPAKAEKASPKKSPRKAEASQDKMTVPVGLDPEKLYNEAYRFVTAAAYPTAEVWFKEFVKRYPDHELADNAYYWLGEVYLVQNDSEKAVTAFSTGLSKFPKGGKAAANLLKGGVAFSRMDKKDYAKTFWEKLLKDFPDAPEAKKAKEELAKLNAG